MELHVYDSDRIGKKNIIYIIIRHCYVVEYVKLPPRGLTSYFLGN